jgi:hypothetical protein
MPSPDIADDQKRLRQLRSSFRACRTVPHELECHIGITQADNFHVFAFECRRCDSELLQFLPDAQRKVRRRQEWRKDPLSHDNRGRGRRQRG